MLPIHDVLPELHRVFGEKNTLVLVAPPGAGKTTMVPISLLTHRIGQAGRILMLEPRRLAARASAARMAQMLNEPVGQTVGYRVRGQSKVSAKTRIEVITEGIFTRMVLEDPALEGVSAVLFDEFHERSLDADLGLALARDVQSVLRDDLHILIMSATLDGGRIADALGAEVLESKGRAFPVTARYLGRDPGQKLEDQVVKAVMTALLEETGSVLVFLPGQGEILRTEERLRARLDRRADLLICPLYGALDPRAQDQAIRPAPDGVRKIVLATSIAETSLTIDGVRVVIDCGYSRVPRFDPATGLMRLETVRVTRAAADQRQGRAGRTQDGVAYRLWDEPETRALIPFGRPEILETDLSRLVLDLARWGARGPEGLVFLDLPPAAAWTEAKVLLQRLGALDRQGDLTPHGRALSQLPLPPRLSHMVLVAAGWGRARLGAQIAMVLTERGLGGTGLDLKTRLERLGQDQGTKAKEAKALCARWAEDAKGLASPIPPPETADEEDLIALLLAEAYPERIAKARGKPGEFMMATGRGVYLDPTEALSKARWLSVGELGSSNPKDRILLACPLAEALLQSVFADRLDTEDQIVADPKGRFKGVRQTRLGKIVLSETALSSVGPEQIALALVEQVRAKGLKLLRFGEACQDFRARVAYARQQDETWPDLSDDQLLVRLSDWLLPMLMGRSSLNDLSDQDLKEALSTLIEWSKLQGLDRLVPRRFEAPTGNQFTIDYGAEAGPTVEIRVGELYGLTEHPCVGARRVPLVLSLLSPAHRPIQVTRDLLGFWKGAWREVRTEMKGRYPKHVWPEDPLAAPTTTRAKPRGS